MTPGIVASLTFDLHRILRENRGCMKQRAMMLAAIEAVTNADTVGTARRLNSDVAAQATAAEPFHRSTFF